MSPGIHSTSMSRISAGSRIGAVSSLQLFRCVIGASLCAWFVAQALQPSAAMTPAVDPRVTANGISGACTTLLLALPARVLWLGWAVAACAIMMGLGSRMAAMLAWYTFHQWLMAAHPDA